MIFITIGTQEPFDRLIKAVDKLAPMLKGIPVVAQVSRSTYNAQNMETHDFLTPEECDAYFEKADLIIGHAGMGTIITALVKKKPILVVPRLAMYGEHRNDHQLATAKALEASGHVSVVYNVDDLEERIISILSKSLKINHQLGDYASEELITSIQKFILS